MIEFTPLHTGHYLENPWRQYQAGSQFHHRSEAHHEEENHQRHHPTPSSYKTHNILEDSQWTGQAC